MKKLSWQRSSVTQLPRCFSYLLLCNSPKTIWQWLSISLLLSLLVLDYYWLGSARWFSLSISPEIAIKLWPGWICWRLLNSHFWYPRLQRFRAGKRQGSLFLSLCLLLSLSFCLPLPLSLMSPGTVSPAWKFRSSPALYVTVQDLKASFTRKQARKSLAFSSSAF